MTRLELIERVRRIIYGGQPSDDAAITVGLVNNLIPDGLAAAAKASWNENIKMDNCGYVNNSFYTSFSDLSVLSEGEFGTYYVTLPQIPTGLGRNEGISSIYLVNATGLVSKPLIQLNINQVAYMDSLPDINGTLCWSEGNKLKIKSPNNPILNHTVKLRMISGGNSTDLNSSLNVPAEYIGMVQDYLLKILMPQSPKQDLTNDGIDKA